MIDIGSREADIFNIMIMIFNSTLACPGIIIRGSNAATDVVGRFMQGTSSSPITFALLFGYSFHSLRLLFKSPLK